MHSEAYAFVRVVASQLLAPRRYVVEIGSRNVNGSVRDLFLGAAYTGIDVQPGPGVDVVVAGEAFRPAARPDTVICCEVFEHTDAADAIIANAHRMLQPGGVFIATMAGTGRGPHSAVDGGPLRDGEFYRNVEAEQLRQWLDSFPKKALQEKAGDLYCVAWKDAFGEVN